MAAHITEALQIRDIILFADLAAGGNTHRSVVCISERIPGADVKTTICDLVLHEAVVGFPHLGKILCHFDQSHHIVKLLDDLHILVAVQENAGGVRCKRCQLVTQDRFHAGDLHRQILSISENQLVFDGFGDEPLVLRILEQHIQKDIDATLHDRRLVDELEVPLLYVVFALSDLFLNTHKGEYLAGLLDKSIQVGTRRNDDVDVGGQTHGTLQQQHQTGAALKDERHADSRDGLQQAKGVHGTLQKQRVPMAGTLQIANVLFGKILFLQHGLTPFLTVICLSAQAPWP
jgi:hypothetical protein